MIEFKPNFNEPDHAEYKGYRYECDANSRIDIYDWRTNYLTTVDTITEADAYVDADSLLTRERSTRRNSHD